MIISKKSILGWYLRTFNENMYYRLRHGYLDICTLWRFLVFSAIFGFAGFFVLLGAIFFQTICILATLQIISFGSIAWLTEFFKGTDATPFALVVLIEVGLAALFFIFKWIKEYRDAHANDYRPPKQPGVLVTYYKAWKEKTCVLVQYSED